MKKKKSTLKIKGLFDFETSTVQFGSEYSKLENKFIAQAIKIPDFRYTIKEPIDAGGGSYYKGTEIVHREEKNAYLIIRNGIIIGYMTPYQINSIKSELLPIPIENKGTYNRIIYQFAEKCKHKL